MIGKLQILTFVGMLESHGEIPGDVPHYAALGGLAGYYRQSRATAQCRKQPVGGGLLG